MRRALVMSVLIGCGASRGGSLRDAPAGDGATADAPSGGAIDAPGAIDGAIDAPVPGDGGATTDPADDGPYSVATSTASIPGATAGRTLPATLFVPTGGPTPRPLVVISPGFQLSRTQYTSLAHHMATWGFAVISTDYADTGLFADHTALAEDVPAAITWALAQSSLAVDAQRVAVAGHSLGGDISAYALSLDPRIKAMVGWDPVDASNPSVVPEKMGSVTAAIAVVGETTDASGGFMPCAPAGDNFQAFFAASPAPAVEVTIVGASHMNWVDDPSCAVCGFCTAGTASAASVHTITRRLDVAWLRRQLLGDTSMDAWIDHPPELATGAISIQRR